MNATPPLPALPALYRNDDVIGRAMRTVGFMVLAVIGFLWMAPSGPPPPGVDLSFEIAMAKWVPVGAVVIAVLALIVLAQRYAWIRRVLSDGVTVQGVVEGVDTHSREASHSENSPAFQRATMKTYYLRVRYVWEGADQQVRLRLPSSPFVFGITKERPVDLIVHPSSPRKPLIRSVYFGRS